MLLHVAQLGALAALRSLAAWDEEPRDGALVHGILLLAVAELGEEAALPGWVGRRILLIVQPNLLKGLLNRRWLDLAVPGRPGQSREVVRVEAASGRGIVIRDGGAGGDVLRAEC